MATIMLFEFTTLALGAALFIWLLVYGEHYEGLVLGFAALLGLAMEWTGVTQFHLHYYSSDFLIVIGSDPTAIPVVIGVGWALVFFTTRRLADRLVTPWYLMPSVAGLLALALDFFLDPMLAQSRIPVVGFDSIEQCVSAPDGAGFGVGAWIWCLPESFQGRPIEQYLGVPIANYLAWFLIVAAYEFVLETAARWYNVPAMSRWRQFLMVAIVIVVTYLLVSSVLWMFQWLAGFGVKNLWILIFFIGLGVLGIALSGLNRRSWGFDWKCIGLLVLDTGICWYGFVMGDFLADPPSNIVWRLALTNAVAIGLALWIMVPPFWQPANNLAGPPAFSPLAMLSTTEIQNARGIADPAADAVMATLFGTDQIDDVNELMANLRDNSHDPDIIDQLPVSLKQFIQNEMQVAPGADQARVRRGQELFLRYSGVAIAALNISSLAESYAMAGSEQVLGRTNRLVRPDAFKRIAETAQFVVYTMMKDGLSTPEAADPGVGKGIIAALRVRLMHAAIRWLILNGTPQLTDTDAPNYEDMAWDKAAHGEPISQMEMAFTLMTFCWVTLRAMHDVGLNFTMQEADDYVYLWRLVGKHLGVQEHLMPQTANEAAGLFEQLKAEFGLQEPSEDAKQLNDSALWVMSEMLARKANLGASLNRVVPRIYQTELLDADTRHVLGTQPLTAFEEIILQPLAKLVFGLIGQIDFFSSDGWAAAFKLRVGRLLLRYFADHPNDVGTDLFEMPEELA